MHFSDANSIRFFSTKHIILLFLDSIFPIQFHTVHKSHCCKGFSNIFCVFIYIITENLYGQVYNILLQI